MTTTIDDLLTEASEINETLSRTARRVVTESVTPTATVRLSGVYRLPDTADGAESDLGYVPSDLLPAIVRIAYPAGAYGVTEWAGLESEREHFVAGRVTSSWRVVRECQIYKTIEGHVSEVDVDDSAEREADSRYEDEISGLAGCLR